MTFEIDPPDEPCPDCGSVHHRSCNENNATILYLDLKNRFEEQFAEIVKDMNDNGHNQPA